MEDLGDVELKLVDKGSWPVTSHWRNDHVGGGIRGSLHFPSAAGQFITLSICSDSLVQVEPPIVCGTNGLEWFARCSCENVEKMSSDWRLGVARTRRVFG